MSTALVNLLYIYKQFRAMDSAFALIRKHLQSAAELTGAFTWNRRTQMSTGWRIYSDSPALGSALRRKFVAVNCPAKVCGSEFSGP